MNRTLNPAHRKLPPAGNQVPPTMAGSGSHGKGTLLTFIGMVAMILIHVTNMVVTKYAFSRGTNRYVFGFYTNGLCCLVILPFAFLCNRGPERPPLTLPVLFRFFFLAWLGFITQFLGYAGIQYSSPMLGTAMLNLVPAFTCILAFIFRMEKLDRGSMSSTAKIMGTVVSIGGAFVVVFYKGPTFMKLSAVTVLDNQELVAPQLNWILGGLFLAAEAFMISTNYIIQALTFKLFAPVMSTLFYTGFFATVFSGIYALLLVDDASAWQVNMDESLLALLYSAVVGVAIRMSLYMWCLSKTGPVYISMFKPLAIIFSVVMDVIFLGEVLGLGSLIGATVIVLGFYAVMWGKATENCADETKESTSGKVPLLQTDQVEEV